MKYSLILLLSILCFSALTIEAKSVEKQNFFKIQNEPTMAFVYITEPQFIAMMSERDLSDLTDNLNETEKTALLQEVNDEAVGEINSYLFNRYQLPAEGSDDKLTTMTKDLMKFRLYKRRDELNLSDNVLKIYAGIVKDLEKIANGTINLQIAKVSSGGGGGESSPIQNIQTTNRPKTDRYRLS